MIFFYSSLALAAYFGLLIYYTHGVRLFDYDWVQLVFWWILGTGLLLVSLLQAVVVSANG